MKRRTLPILLLSLILIMTGCGSKTDTQDITEDSADKVQQSVENGQDTEDNSVRVELDTQIDTSDMFSNRDYKTEYDESESAVITLTGDSASCSSDAVAIDGSTITIKDEGTYIVSGNLDNGMLIVDADDSDKLQIVLNNVSIHSETSAPIYILEADKVFITLAEGSTNSLSNGGTFTAIDDNNIDGALFSKQDLTLNGSGSLTITSPAGHGIVCKDDLVFTSGSYTIDAASHGMDVNDSVRIADAALTITSGKDGIHVENSDDEELGFVYVVSGTLTIDAQEDGMSAGAYILITGGNITIDSADDSIHSNTSVTIYGGAFEIASGDDAIHADETLTVTGGSINISQSYEGLEGLHVVVAGGEITLAASDDGINAAGGADQSGYGGPRGRDRFGGGSSSSGSILISGGKLSITSSGDGLDANGTLEISGGYTVVCGPTMGDTATLDYDVSGVITGGTFIGTGAYQMAQSFSDSSQGVVAVSVGNQQAGTEITLRDAEGNTVVTHTPDLSYAIVIYSSPEIIKGETYRLTVGADSGEITAN